ncbi:MAG: hypothetical protein J7K59_04475 [Candidatus Korarchaeota archaeon]|nr:hypothetical protein [Candidatus Korarchaeota archaeon]
MRKSRTKRLILKFFREYGEGYLVQIVAYVCEKLNVKRRETERRIYERVKKICLRLEKKGILKGKYEPNLEFDGFPLTYYSLK